MSRRPPAIHHSTSQPLQFFGRREEIALLNRALAGGPESVVAFVGPGGQGKTAIVQHWLGQLTSRLDQLDGLFFWSFYRGKDSDLCLRQLLAYALDSDSPPQISASYAVDRLLPMLQNERWAIVLDGTEVVQHEEGTWRGRLIHPELGRLLEEVASAPMPGVIVLTSRFALPQLEGRRHARILSLASLDNDSGQALLKSLGVQGSPRELTEAAQAVDLHAKAVELLGTLLVRYYQGRAECHSLLPPLQLQDASSEEIHVLRVLNAFRETLSAEQKDILALATAFRLPPTESRLLEYLASAPVAKLLHEHHSRTYEPFSVKGPAWLAAQIQELVALRLLERVGLSVGSASHSNHTADPTAVIDAHPLVRRGFEDVLGGMAHAKAGFLRGRPDRRPPHSLEEAREEVELFHSYCDAALWNEADSTFVNLDNPKHRFLAPVFERDLLLRFFPEGDWRRPPLWPGFGRYRSLAICLEMMGQYEDALEVYRPADAPLRGDALIALGRLQEFQDIAHVAQPWQTLWQAYRAHALALLGRRDEALQIAGTLVPVDIYEWVHVFEGLLRLGRLDLLDLRSLLYRPPFAEETRWSALARRRMKADYVRLGGVALQRDLGEEYRELIEEYDRGGLPFERALSRLGYARWLQSQGRHEEVQAVATAIVTLARRFGMTILEKDGLGLLGQSKEPVRP